MKNEFVLAFNEVLEEKQLPRDVIREALKAAMVAAYRRAVGASNAQLVEAEVDLETGRVSISAEKEIVETVQDPRTEVSLAEARKVDPHAELGGMVVVETTPRNFGRVAAQTARQVIQQRIREAEREAQMEYYSKQVGEIVSGVVQAINAQGITLGLDMKAEGIMPRNQQVPGERFRVHDRVRALLLEVKNQARGPQIILSRGHRNFLRRLLENEVPEIYHGMVEIRSIAREPGQRSKVAVAALQPGVDPVGACVGVRGVRIQAIVRELNDEKIDVIEWNPDPAAYIAKALSPARVTGVYLNEQAKGAKTATVVVPEDQLSLAIGRDGQNARLAAKLTAWRIDIKSLPEAAADTLHKVQTEAEYAQILEQESDVLAQVSAILAKKAEGRPVMPEEYTVLSQFVDRVERSLIQQRQKDLRAEEYRQRVSQVDIPEEAYKIPLEDLGISPRVTTVLGGAGYTTVGDLLLQLKLDENEVLRLNGIGPRTMTDIQNAIEKLQQQGILPAPAVEAGAVAEAEAAPEAAPEAVEAAAPETLAPVGETAAELAMEAVAAEITEGEPVLESEVVAAAAEEQAAEAPAALESPELEAVAETAVAAPEPVEETSSLDELFSLTPDVIDFAVIDEDEDEEEEEAGGKGKKKKKKKKRFVEAEYDPDADVVLYKKKRKRSDEEWGDDW